MPLNCFFRSWGGSGLLPGSLCHLLHVYEDGDGVCFCFGPFSRAGQRIRFCPCALEEIYHFVCFALIDLARDSLLPAELGLELLQRLLIANFGHFLLVIERCEWVRLRGVALERQVALVVHGEEGFDFDALTGLKHVQSEQVWRLKVRPSHVVLVDIGQIKDPLVRVK